jgi:rRNA-processing protein FCF1
MRIPRIYLETTIFNFAFADDAPDKKADTLKLFEEIKQGKYIAFTSDYVLDELDKAEEPKRSKMLKLVKQYGIKTLPSNTQIGALADIYVKERIYRKNMSATLCT